MHTAAREEDTSLHTFSIHKDAVSALHLVGDTLYSGSYDCSVARIDLHQGAAAHTFHGSESMVHCVHEREGQVYIGNDGGEIVVLDTSSGKAAATLHGHRRAVTCLTTEENMLYSGSKDSIIRQWDIRTHKCLKKIRVHTGPVTCVEMIDGAMYSGSWDGTLYTFENGEGRRQMDPKTSAPLLAVTACAGLLYAAYRDGRARVWAPRVEKVVTTFVAHEGGIPAILVDEQARMYLGSEDRSISVWDLKMQASFVDAEKRVCVYKGHSDGVLSLAKGDTLLYSGSYDHSIKIWDLKAVDRALVPGLAEFSLPLHRLSDGCAGGPVAASRADPDWWKTKPPLGGPYVQARLGLRLDHNMLVPTVHEVFPDSAADFAGMQVGDQLTKLNDFDLPSVDLLQECMAYLRPREAVELHYEKRMPNGSYQPKTAKFEIEDPDQEADDSLPAIVTPKLLLSGIYDVLDKEKATMPQVDVFLDVVAKNADFFRKIMLKYGEVNDASSISARSFWLMCSKCKLVTPKCSLAHLNRLFILNRIRQLFPHPRVQDIATPHSPGAMLHIEDLIFGFVRLASCKYQNLPDHPARFERLLNKHLMPLALEDTPDILTQVGLGKVDEAVPHQQQRAVLKLFSKFSGSDAPEQAMLGSGFLKAMKALNLPPPCSADEYLHSVLEDCQQLYCRAVDPNDKISPDSILEREIVPDELIYCLAVIGKRVEGKPEKASLWCKELEVGDMSESCAQPDQKLQANSSTRVSSPPSDDPSPF